jgi:transcriptional regulator with XRE-family HTH domain
LHCHREVEVSLEKVSGVSNALISQIETGKVKDPGFTTVIRLVDALGITLDRAATCARDKLSILRKCGISGSGTGPQNEPGLIRSEP